MIQIRRVAVVLWWCALVAWIAVMVIPVSVTMTRLAAAGGLLLLWLGALALLWRTRTVFLALLAAGVLPGLWLLLPGRATDQEKLRMAYLRHLTRYEGTRYVWGRENRLGMDCSGLVRRAWIHANLERGIFTLNPLPVRKALSMVWNDRTAMDLRDGAMGLTRKFADSRSPSMHWTKLPFRPGRLPSRETACTCSPASGKGNGSRLHRERGWSLPCPRHLTIRGMKLRLFWWSGRNWRGDARTECPRHHLHGGEIGRPVKGGPFADQLDVQGFPG